LLTSPPFPILPFSSVETVKAFSMHPKDYINSNFIVNYYFV
jgi:hypothetical protein